MIKQLFRCHFLNCLSFSHQCERLHLSYLKPQVDLALYLGSLSISLAYLRMDRQLTVFITQGLCPNIWFIGPNSFPLLFLKKIFFSCSSLFHMSFKKPSNIMDHANNPPYSVFSHQGRIFNHLMCPCSFHLILYLIKISFLLPVVLFLKRAERQDMSCLCRQSLISLLLF